MFEQQICFDANCWDSWTSAKGDNSIRLRFIEQGKSEATTLNIQLSIFSSHLERWPRSPDERGLPFGRKQVYLRALLEALSGLILDLLAADAELIWEARLQLPFFHFVSGSGHAVQYQPDENSDPRLQPWHCSTTWWQIPPLYEHPSADINGHSIPSFMVVQFIGITPFTEKICIKKAGKELNPAGTENSKLAEYNGTDFKCQYKYHDIF